MNTRTLQKQQTRQKILTTAYNLFSIHGFVTINTVEIAKAADVSHGLLFAHFHNREELINAAIHLFKERTAAKIHDCAQEKSSLAVVLQMHLQGLAENELFYTHLIAEAHLLSRESQLQLIAIQSAISIHIAVAASREMESGIIKTVPNDLLFNTWIGLLHHYLLNRTLFIPEGSIIERFGQNLLDHYLFLLSNNQSRRTL
ncbi:MAG: TetR/AcrR family transcriptional regulator [Chitinivibrionales bacterium]|nr:TetR/AcrR family transcriptional regulator [Chitinivibrionales bacterium]